MKKIKILSLFTGAGGMDLGFILGGCENLRIEKAMKEKEYFQRQRANSFFEVVWANDIFPEARETYLKNIDKTTYKLGKIEDERVFPKADTVIGGFPCPGYSIAGPRREEDPRNKLYLEFVRVLKEVKPITFVAENVKGILSLSDGRVFKRVLKDFESAGYDVFWKLIDAGDYNAPQKRERVFLVGVKKVFKEKFDFPEKQKNKITLRDAIKDLENKYGEYYKGGFSSMYMSRNRKKAWNDQSFTIQASGRHAPLHPSGYPMKKIEKDKWIFQNGESSERRLSVDEIKRIQTFPDWFSFSKGASRRNENGKIDFVYKQIGNAVPVELARLIAKKILEMHKKIDKSI